jgi:Protein of unknown function (DUF2911)
MRHRALTLSSVLAVSLGLAATATAQMNLRGETKVTLAGKPIVVEYGRPSLKGRDMLGQAVVGQEWRMGADTATTLKTPASLSFGSTHVPAGEYVLRAKKVSATDWVLLLKRGGESAAEVPLQASPLDKSVEIFTIDLAEEQGQGVFRMSWGNLALSTRFAVR